jgi:hypothetical protein
MLREPLVAYLREEEEAIRRIAGAHVEQYEEEVLSADRINLRVRVRFTAGHLLELNDAVVVEMRRPDLFFMAHIKAAPIAAKYRAKNREGREDHGLGSASPRTWGRQPVAHAAAHGGKPWRYLLIPHDAIVGGLTLAGSHERFGGGVTRRDRRCGTRRSRGWGSGGMHPP